LTLQDSQTISDVVLTLARGGVLTGTVFDDAGRPMPGIRMMAWEIETTLGGERTLKMAAETADGVATDDRGIYRIFGLAPGEYTVGTFWAFHGAGVDVRVPSDEEIRAAFQATKQAGPAPSGSAVSAPSTSSRTRHNYSQVFAPGVVDHLTAATWTLGPGEERTGIDIRMQFLPRSSIEGMVIMPGGALSTNRPHLSISRRNRVASLNSTRVSSVGADGKFVAASLSPDTYTVMVETSGSPGVPPLWALADVTLIPGEAASLTLTLQPALSMTGRVIFQGTALPPPADLSTVALRLRTLGPASVSTTQQIDAAGSVTIGGIVPGRYAIAGSVPGAGIAPGKPRWSVRSVMLGDRDVTDLPFDITGSGMPELTVTFTDLVSELSGSLTTASGQPAIDAFIVIMPADRERWFTLTRRITSTRPDRSGRYVFHGLPAGDYRIAVTTDDVSAELNDANALAQLAAQSAPVTMTTGEKRVLDLRLAISSPPVSGRQ
jgi:protocatechuate 3,4-dioxygenase beta subunit